MRAKRLHKERGSFLLEMIVALGIAAVVLTLASDMTMSNLHKSLDTEIVLETENKARAILDLMLFDLRMLGSGIPFNQDGFTMTESDGDISQAALPLYTDSTASYLHFRINELGKTAVLTSAYDPELGSTIYVDTTEDFAEDDFIYISDETAGGSDGLQGSVASIGSGSLALDGDMAYTEGGTFPVGSVVNRVVELEYTSPNGTSGITRNNGYGDVVLSPGSTFTVSYIDAASGALTPPLDEDEIETELAGLVLTVEVRSSSRLKDGTFYTASASGQVTVRSLK